MRNDGELDTIVCGAKKEDGVKEWIDLDGLW
jgi:hypothetical protein